MKVAILGAGMSSILSRWACIQFGIEPDMYAKDIPTMKKGGVKFIHDDCGIRDCLYSQVVNIFKTNEGYSRYEDTDVDTEIEKYRIKNSGEKVENRMKLKYSEPAVMWRDVESRTGFNPNDVKISSLTRDDVKDMENEYDLVISTIPLFIIYPELKEQCTSRVGWVTESLPEPVEDFGLLNWCVYNCRQDDKWYRASRVFGYEQTEWIEEVPDSVKIFKVKGGPDIEPLQDNGKLLLTGRYGLWNKSELVHDSYYRVKELLRNMLSEEMPLLNKYDYKVK